ncbi:MAG: hypothetical protein JJ713_05655 [Acidithiobacillus sp.]|nr:hypothetical protein [Acidithiobacillus sp.]MCE5420254.1 hypothetical protein [Acidithiobacillus sp.]
MPWTQARDFSAAIVQLERERLLHGAVAFRAAQAEEKGWKEWLQAVSV